MLFDIVTIFADFFGAPSTSGAHGQGILGHGILERALRNGLAEVRTHDLRDFTHDRHRTVDDRPFGGGEGMVLKAAPIFDCVDSLGIVPKPTRDTSRESVILLSAQGKRFTQATARRLATLDRVVLICGRYEGVDERVPQLLCDEELSIGDYVLSGGELGAAIIIDAVVRLIPGVLGHADSSVYESFGAANVPSMDSSPDDGHPPRGAAPEARTDHPSHSGASSESRHSSLSGGSASLPQPHKQPPPTTNPSGGLLDYPHYTRPADFRGTPIPELLSNGDHRVIRRWRRQAALAKTLANRPDLLANADLSDQDREFLATLDPS